MQKHDSNEYTRAGNPVPCGDWIAGSGRALCDRHLAEAMEAYPQGWAYYPGDTCIHGCYVGGCGVDWMCHDCEMGYTEWHDNPTYGLVLSINGEPLRGHVATWMHTEHEAGYHAILKAAHSWADVLTKVNEVGVTYTLEWETHMVASGYWGEPAPAL